MSFFDPFIVAQPQVPEITVSLSPGIIEQIITQMEKQNPTKTYFETGFIEPGFDNYQCPARSIKKIGE